MITKHVTTLATLIAATRDLIQSSGCPEAGQHLRDLKEVSDELTSGTNEPMPSIEENVLFIHEHLAQLDPNVALMTLSTVVATTGIQLVTMLAPTGRHPWLKEPANLPKAITPFDLAREKAGRFSGEEAQEKLRVVLGEFGATCVSGVAPDRIQELNARLDECLSSLPDNVIPLQVGGELDPYRVGTPHPTGLNQETEDALVFQGYDAARLSLEEKAVSPASCPFPADTPEAALWLRGATNFHASLKPEGDDGPVPQEEGEPVETAPQEQTDPPTATEDAKGQ